MWRKGVEYMSNNCCMVLKIIGVSVYNGTSRGGKQYTLTNLELDYQGRKVKIKGFQEGAKIGDYAQIGIEQNRCAMACQGCGIAIFCFL